MPHCRSCQSDNLTQFAAELAMHFPGLEGLTKPIVLVHPKLMICLDCGFAEFVVPEAEKEQLRRGMYPAQAAGALDRHREEQLQ